MLQFKKLDERAKLPTRANPWDAGLDLYALEDSLLEYGRVVPVRTGLATAIPQGQVGLLTIRSSLGKRNIQIANAPGIIDSGYRGEIIVMLVNNHYVNNPYDNYNNILISGGERIAQLVVAPFVEHFPTFVDELLPSDGREQGGFGSSGK